jgi:PBP1b-binding outer membrane lipoprotein LpoB
MTKTILLLVVILVGCSNDTLSGKPEFKQNQMVDGCVMQKSYNVWVRTCG